MRRRTVALALLVVGCSTATPPSPPPGGTSALATPTPIVIYVTPEPTGAGTRTRRRPPEPRRSAVPSPVSTRPPGDSGRRQFASLAELRPGECFDQIDDRRGRPIGALVLPCDRPHQMEVFGVARHPAGRPAPWPGEEELEDFSEDRCAARFEEYVGIDYDDSELDAAFFAPSRATWAEGDRTVTCVIREREGGRLDRSYRGSRQ